MITMDNAIPISIPVTFALIIGVIIGSTFGIVGYAESLIKECQKLNNVYNCEIIAVPKSED